MSALSRPLRRRPSRQRGVASLIVVMVLFFIVSLVAAYTNRNLIFEQRTSGNQYRSTQALEAAQAGLDWALSMLNSGRIADSCATSTSVADPSFRQRYLATDPDTGLIAVNRQSDGVSPLLPSCVFNGTDWSCNCPADGNPVLAAPAGTGVFPAFRLRFVVQSPARPGLVRIESNGCTRLDNACLNFPANALAGEGRATLSAVIALRSGLPAPPVAALTARTTVDLGGAALGLISSDPRANGITVLAGGAVNDAGLRLQGPPGTPAASTLAGGDASLSALSADRMFTNNFGALPAVYRQQPAAVVVPCGGGTCSAAQARDAAALHPGHVLWIEGDLDFNGGGDVGTPAEPVLLVVEGNVVFSVPLTVHGLVYSRTAAWASSGAGAVRGAVVAEGSMGGSATTDITHDVDVLGRLRHQFGSFVLVPGSWKDFE